MSNLKSIFSLVVFCLVFSELLIYNEEIFILICFFIFFNIIFILAGRSLSDTFETLSSSFEKDFISNSIASKKFIFFHILGKKQAFEAISRTFIVLNVFRNNSVQKELLLLYSCYLTFVITSTQVLFYLTGLYKLHFMTFFQIYIMNSKNNLKILYPGKIPKKEVNQS
jgi:hypothetical protein